MKHIIHKANGRTFLLQELPGDAKQIRMRFQCFLTYRRQHSSHITHFFEGKYTIIGKADELIKEKVFDFIKDGIHRPFLTYWNYVHSFFYYLLPSSSALSLLKLHNLKPETTLIIEQI